MEIFLVAGEVIRLNAAGWSAAVLPETGGAIASLCHEGQPVLRRADPDVDDVLDCASFALIPFANRIGDADLRFGDQVLPLEPDPAALPHALHGHGWRVAWSVKRVSPSEVEERQRSAGQRMTFAAPTNGPSGSSVDEIEHLIVEPAGGDVFHAGDVDPFNKHLRIPEGRD